MQENNSQKKVIPATPQTPLKKDTCKSLSGRSTLTYEVGQTKDGLMLRITGNSGGGQFNNHWVVLANLQQCLEAQEKPFSTSALKPLFKGQSVNTAGFLLAVLKHLGLLEAREEGYLWVKNSQALEAITKKKPPVSKGDKVFWFSVNWRIQPFELVYSNGGIHHAQKTEKLHSPGEGFHSQAAPC